MQTIFLSVILCPNPGPFSNGVRQNSRNSFECGAILTHSCDSGFALQVRELSHIMHNKAMHFMEIVPFNTL